MGAFAKVFHTKNQNSRDYEYFEDKPSILLSSVLLLYRKPLRQLGLDNPWSTEEGGQRLGKGAFGAAFELPARAGKPKRVLKLTRDLSEAATSQLLLGKTPEHVVHIYRVWSLRETKLTDNHLTWYAIEREYLDPINKKDRDLLELIGDMWDDSDLDLEMPYGRAMKARWENYLKNEFWNDRADTFNGPAVKRCMNILQQISIGAKDLANLGVIWEDLHSDNVMLNKIKRYKISDVGFGDFPNGFSIEFTRLKPTDQISP